MNTANPFPGMIPYLEASWADVHTVLIAGIRESISDVLPPDLTVRAEEAVTVGCPDGDRELSYRTDVSISRVDRDQTHGLPKVGWASSGPTIEVAQPVILEVEPQTERWVSIRDTYGRLVTVIEVLSPSNKSPWGRTVYLKKQENYLAAGVGWLEIDLLRAGQPVFPEAFEPLIEPAKGTRYLIAATRANQPWRRELYYCPLRERLPAVRVPLRITDPDVPLDLQPLIDRVYRTGRYWQILSQDVPPPPLPPDDAEWVRQRLQDAGFATSA